MLQNLPQSKYGTVVVEVEADSIETRNLDTNYEDVVDSKRDQCLQRIWAAVNHDLGTYVYEDDPEYVCHFILNGDFVLLKSMISNSPFSHFDDDYDSDLDLDIATLFFIDDIDKTSTTRWHLKAS